MHMTHLGQIGFMKIFDSKG